MSCDYIIVQAGGKGTRMGTLTRNKPKALVPVNNLPMIMHLFRKYPEKKFIVIGDYKYDVLDKYLNTFSDVDLKMVCASGKTGTCAGIKEAISYIPDNERFMLIWCDLVLADDYSIPETDNNVIGIAKDFLCRWKYENNKFEEVKSLGHGVAGHFVFKNKSFLFNVPDEGEFVKWLQFKQYVFEEQSLYRTHEYGLYEEWDKLSKSRCRPFNKIEIKGEKVYKYGIDEQGKQLAIREVAWYKKLQEVHFDNIPHIYEYEPAICMEKIDGKNIYEYTDISFKKKKKILKQIVECLKQVHNLESVSADEESYRTAYLNKTYDRLKKVRNLVPFANDEYVVINEKKCRNIFFHQKEVEEYIMGYMPKKFKLIHGDCTFSNMMLKNDSIPMLIDPRGYFGNTEIFGDVAYDWVKLYYSIISNYDQFNLKRFNLYINEQNVKIEIASNNWEDMESTFFDLVGNEISIKQMKLFLAITWLSLTTYAWEDYDSICGAFYNGLYYLEEYYEYNI